MTPELRIIRDGVMTNYEVSFPVTRPTDIKVTTQDKLLTINLDYIVTGSNEDLKAGRGRVELFNKGNKGDLLVFLRDTSPQRLTDFDQVARFDEKLIYMSFLLIGMFFHAKLLNDACLFLPSFYFSFPT